MSGSHHPEGRTLADVPTAETANDGPLHRARASLTALETLDRLRQTPHTPPSPDDLAALSGWSGWGPLAPALQSSRAGSWKQIGDRIAYLLPREHYDHGIQATYNAFYSPPEIASACWDILTGLGFTGGRILEPGCGAGVFMASTPTHLAAIWTGIERDPTTAAIAGLLHPTATIHASRLEETPLASRSVDAVLGNVPFGDTKVFDPTTPGAVTASLHNYFLWRSVQALRPGGVAVLLTSRYTLDAAGDTAQLARSAIAWDADLLGAIRLPNGALRSRGTDALTDILVLRRRRPGDPLMPGHDQWIATAVSVADQQVNAYLLANPAMVLGELAEDSAPRYGRTLRVDARPDDPPLPAALATAGRAIVEQAEQAGRTWRIDVGAAPITAQSAPFELRADGRKEGSFHLVDGAVYEVVDAQLAPVSRPGKELPKLVALRDAVLELLDAEADHGRPDADLAPLRAEANRLYDAYVTAHGYLNRYTVVEGKPDQDGVIQSSRRRPAMGGFRRDPDFVTVLALEDFDDDTRTATKAALLTRRINRPRQRAAHAESPIEAIAVCRDELGILDLDRVAQLLGVEQAEAERQIAEVAFRDPATNHWVPADEYLTGNVRQKLAYAKTAALLDPERYSRNVPALETVIPSDLQPEQILANLGAPWIPASDVQDFALELLGFRSHVWHEPRTSTWSVRTSRRAEESAAATSEWGTGRLNAYHLLEYGLNGKAPVIYDVIDDKRVRNQDETLAAGDRLDAIAARFATWVWEDPARADRLAADYNRTFNAVVPRRFDGAHLTFPGLDSGFDPYLHQRDMVARMISGDDALCPYPVGTGKTATMFMAAIKLKALGLASKPLIIVVPSTLEQIARDGKRLFPNARILMAGKEDLADQRARKLFAARCAMEDWDAVVMSHPSFTSLPVHPSVQADYVANLAAEYRSALIAAKTDGADPRKIKQIAKMVDNLEAEAKRTLAHATDDGVFFEHLGVDYLLVDEMHYFKNLGVPVHTDGFSINGSKRAQDLDMKLSWLRDRHPGHAVVTGFTGTPVSNTLLEAFVLQHYLQPQRLAELGLQSADAWAANFVRFATAVEVTPDGGFKLNRRPAEIINIPDLMNTLGEFAELRPPESFPVTRPEARRHTIAIEASDIVLDYVRSLAERADDIHAGGVPSSVDNILKICTDGRKVALHESLVGLTPVGHGKVGALVENIARIYHQTKDLLLPGDEAGMRGRLQLVFCDLGTPNKVKGNQVYGLIRHELVAAGVPAEGIRFIHEATTDARRLVLFDQCTKGDVAVLLGSTDKLGVGVNVQRRAIALHHVDAPWRPDQVEQRDGRIWRPKNLNPAIDIYRYVTEGSFDAFMWQALERKEKSLRPILSGQATARSIEDIGDIALDYGQIKAISTGNPLLTELNEVAFEVKRLTSLATSHQRTQRRLRSDIQTLTMQASAAATTVEALDAVATAAAQNSDDTRWRDAHGNPLPKDEEIAVLGALAESTLAKGYCSGAVQWRGLTIDFTANTQWRETELAARITTPDRHRITASLKAAWAAKGQHWRIRDAIAAAVTDAHLTTTATRENIDVLKQRIAEHDAALGQPFSEAATLEAARTRRALLDVAIREQAQKDEEARRNRTARNAADSSSSSPTGDRRALLQRLHSVITAVVERAGINDAREAHGVGDVSSVSRGASNATRPSDQTNTDQISAKPGSVDKPVHDAAPALETEGASDNSREQVEQRDNVASPAEGTERYAEEIADPPGTIRGPRSTRAALVEHPADNSATTKSAAPQVTTRAFAQTRTPADRSAPQPSRPTSPSPSRPSKTPDRSALFEHAIDLALQGFAVFPLRPKSKTPLIKDWENHATTDTRQIAHWWTAHPHANVAIACGPSNLLVLDLDAAKKLSGPRHGQQTLTALAAGREIPRTFTVASARGGRHLYFRQPDGAALRNTTGSNRAGLGPLIDTRGHGGYIVAPGSDFKGGTYRIEHGASVAPLPSWITRELATRHSMAALPHAPAPSRMPITDRRRTAYGNAALRRSANTVATAPEGTRNDTLNREAFRLGRLIGGGIIEHDDAVTTLRRAARKAGLLPIETETTIGSGLSAGISYPRSIPEEAPDPQTPSPTKETSMSVISAQAPSSAEPAIAAPPRAADLYPHLSAPGSRAFQDALRALWRLGPTAIGLPETSAEPIRAAWQEAGEQMAATIHEHETAQAPDTRAEAITTADAALPEPAAEEDLSAESKANFEFEDIWADVRATIERARQALPDWPELNTTDDLKPALDDIFRHFAQAPIPRNDVGHDDAATAAIRSAKPASAAPELTMVTTEPGTGNTTCNPSAEDLDTHLAAMDTAYTDARSTGIPDTSPEWAGISAIHTAIHNLWDTIKATAGTYWAKLNADTHLHGLLTTLATRAARAIAHLANAAADRLEQHTSQQPLKAAPAQPGLREAYINARNQIKAHATSHEWQRITALWGTVNTLSRQAADPGIRAVIARSADAIADHADTLSRKMVNRGGRDPVAHALGALARAAEWHAAMLRGTASDIEQNRAHTQPQVVVNDAPPPSSPVQLQQNAEAQALQARARQVAQRAQARLGHVSNRLGMAPRRSLSTAGQDGRSVGMRPARPCEHEKGPAAAQPSLRV